MSLWAAGLLRCVMPHLFLSEWASNPADEDQDLPLAPGHAVERGRRRGGLRGGELPDEAAGHRVGEQGLSGGYHPDGGEDVVQRHVLDQESAGTRA